MDPIWLVFLLPVAAASGWLARGGFTLSFRKRPKIPSVYLEGINYLLNEQHDKAIEIFINKLEVDSDTIEIHLSLGNLYRRRGDIERASLIHKNLMDRPDLNREHKVQAIFELGHDFYAAGILDRAENIFTELTQDTRYEERAYDVLRDIYEQEREWNDCIRMTNRLNRISSKDYSSLLAQYYCEKTEAAIQEGRYDAAEENISESLSANGNCIRAIIQSGRVKAIRGNHKAAIATWRTIQHKNPKFISETLDLIIESYKAIRETEELFDFLKKTAETNLDPQLAIAYVDVLEAHKEKENAEEFLADWIRKNSSLSCLLRFILMKIKSKDSEPNSDSMLIEGIINRQFKSGRRYECQCCGYSVKTLHWQCPSCRSWDTLTAAR